MTQSSAYKTAAALWLYRRGIGGKISYLTTSVLPIRLAQCREKFGGFEPPLLDFKSKCFQKRNFLEFVSYRLISIGIGIEGSTRRRRNVSIRLQTQIRGGGQVKSDIWSAGRDLLLGRLYQWLRGVHGTLWSQRKWIRKFRPQWWMGRLYILEVERM